MAQINNIIMIGKRVASWYKEQGFIKTCFGYMHKDWISEAMRMGWISGDDPNDYRLVVLVKTDFKSKREGRTITEEKKEKYDLSRTDAFFNYLHTKREVFEEQNRGTIKKMADFIREKGNPKNKAEVVKSMPEKPKVPDYTNQAGEPLPF